MYICTHLSQQNCVFYYASWANAGSFRVSFEHYIGIKYTFLPPSNLCFAEIIFFSICYCCCYILTQTQRYGSMRRMCCYRHFFTNTYTYVLYVPVLQSMPVNSFECHWIVYFLFARLPLLADTCICLHFHCVDSVKHLIAKKMSILSWTKIYPVCSFFYIFFYIFFINLFIAFVLLQQKYCHCPWLLLSRFASAHGPQRDSQIFILVCIFVCMYIIVVYQ